MTTSKQAFATYRSKEGTGFSMNSAELRNQILATMNASTYTIAVYSQSVVATRQEGPMTAEVKVDLADIGERQIKLDRTLIARRGLSSKVKTIRLLCDSSTVLANLSASLALPICFSTMTAEAKHG